MDYELRNTNVALLSGTVVSEPVYSHFLYGEKFFESSLSVPRLSGQCDRIPFTISERLLIDSGVEVGDNLSFAGQLRSYNKVIEGKSRLLLTMFVREIVEKEALDNPNTIDIVGYVCKKPIYRTTPFNREISDVLVAVNRQYNKSDYLPCIAWGRNARFMRDLPVGAKISLNGRIQSREYQKRLGGGTVVTRVAYEVSINQLERSL